MTAPSSPAEAGGGLVDKISGYWFAASDRLPHGDGRLVVLGETHSLDGEIVLCSHALHASRHPFDALGNAPGPYLYRVRCWGDVIEENDKLGARHREYIAMRDATNMLRQFSRQQALSVIHLWEPPDIVRQYLETGEETIRAASWDASRYAARYAAWSAAWDAARYAAWAAAWDAPWVAARGAARYAAWDVASDAVSDVASDAVSDVARTRFNDLVSELFDGPVGHAKAEGRKP